MADLKEGVAKSDNKSFKCFSPRHGIRLKQEDRTTDLVICFECGWIYIYDDPQATTHIVVKTMGEGYEIINSVLVEASVPLAERKY